MDLSSSLLLVDLKLSVANRQLCVSFYCCSSVTDSWRLRAGIFTFFDSESGINSLGRELEFAALSPIVNGHYS